MSWKEIIKSREQSLKFLMEDIGNVISELEELRDSAENERLDISSDEMRDISTALGKVSALLQ